MAFPWGWGQAGIQGEADSVAVALFKNTLMEWYELAKGNNYSILANNVSA